MKNEYEVRGEVTVIFLNRKDGSRLEALIDTADLPIVQSVPGAWCAVWAVGSKTFYATSHPPRKKTSPKLPMYHMHRMIMDPPHDREVDHRHHNGLDNRRKELSVATRCQNLQNSRHRLGPSGVRGVIWNKRQGKWECYIHAHGKRHFVGLFRSKRIAIRKRMAVRRTLMMV